MTDDIGVLKEKLKKEISAGLNCRREQEKESRMVTEKEQRIKSLEAAGKMAEEKYDAFVGQVHEEKQKSEKQIDQTQKLIHELKEKEKELRGEIRRLSEETEKEKSKYERLVKEKAKQIKDLKSTAVELNCRVEQCEDKHGAIRIQNQQLGEDIKRLNRAIERKDEAIHQLQSDVKLS